MRSRISENEALRKALRDAYFYREERELGDLWQSKVMGHIREIGPLKVGAGFWPVFEHLVWRLAPVSCLLVLSLTVLLLSMDLDHGYDYLGTLTAEFTKTSLAELFGLGG